MTRYASNFMRCRSLHLQKKIQTSPAMAALFWMQDAFLLMAIDVGCSIQLSPCCSCIPELPQCDMHADSVLAQKIFNNVTMTPYCNSAHLLAGFLHCFALHAYPVKTTHASVQLGPSSLPITPARGRSYIVCNHDTCTFISYLFMRCSAETIVHAIVQENAAPAGTHAAAAYRGNPLQSSNNHDQPAWRQTKLWHNSTAPAP